MRQLSGHDASFIYLETPKAHMAGASLLIDDQSTAPGGRVTFKGILENLEGRLHLHVVSSYCGEVIISITGDRDMLLPDPGTYADCLQSSFEDLALATS
jgi:WS/DGAT C-terminal domain